jgi:hypothetical protein
MNRPWLKATVVSLAISVLFTLGTSILFGGGRSYPPEIEWRRVEAMKYREAQEYLVERSKQISGWEALVQGAQSPRYWGDLFVAWLSMFVFAFACCTLLLWWLGIARAPSNPTVDTDARKDGARRSP